MAAPPPPPPSNATTIGKYIARFRHESPRPRDARATAQRSDFWWLESRRETASASPGKLSLSNDGDSDGSRAPMEWELELLSATSAEEAASVASLASADDDAPSASRRDGDGVPSPSPSSLSSSWRAARELDVAVRTLQRRSPREQDAPALVDDGFVVLPTDAMDEKAMLAASLEDPELVIQRIRRRLGFQPPASTAVAYTPTDTPLLSPMYSDDLASESSYDFASPPAAAMEQAFYDGYDTTGRSSLRLEMSESMENVITGATDSLVSPAASVESAVALASEGSSISLDNREPQVPTEENKQEAKEEARVDETQVVHEDVDGDCTEPAVDPAMLREESCDEKASPRECERSPSTADSAVEQPITPQQVMAAGKTSRSNSPRRDPRSEPPHSPFSQNDRTKLPSVVDEGEPREKRSPRLPPLSPARGPVFKPALPITPRSLDAKEPEIPPETSKTLDNLLSFVVQSWGENSFFGGTDSEDGETKSIDSSTTPKTQERAKEQPFLNSSTITTPASRDEETTCIPRTSEKSQAPGGGESEPKSQPDTPSDDVDSDLEIGDGAVEFASDPVVAMLSDRISMLEDALQRLDSKD
jgi:hypothetical protein